MQPLPPAIEAKCIEMYINSANIPSSFPFKSSMKAYNQTKSILTSGQALVHHQAPRPTPAQLPNPFETAPLGQGHSVLKTNHRNYLYMWLNIQYV